MRHPIENSSRDGTAKSTAAVEWVGENGEPEIAPTHWYPAPRNQYRLREGERSLLAASSFIVILGAATLIATPFSAEVAAYVMRYTGHEVMHIAEQESRLANRGPRKTDLVARRQVEAYQASGPAEAQQAAQVQQVAAVFVPEAQQSLMEDRAEGWALEPMEARRVIEALDVQLQAEASKSARSLEEEREKAAALAREAAVARNELAASTEQHRQMLSEQRDRSAAVASELATVQWNVETRVVQSNETANGAAQLKAAVSVASSELQGERQRAEVLASELVVVRREAQAAVSSRKYDEPVQQKQVAERAIASLQPSLQHDGDRTEAIARDFASVPHTMDGRVAVGRSPESHTVQVTQTVKTAATTAPKATETQGNVEAAKLIARARVLLGQGNIGAARIVLERAAESGNAQANFMLAETYDPVILSAWGTYGTRGEAPKAREHYAKAHAGGIREAKDRLDVLRQ